MQVVPCYPLTSLWDLIGLQKLDSCLSYGSRQTNGLRRVMWPHPQMIQRLHDSSHLKREKENNINVSQGSPIFSFQNHSFFIMRKTFLHCNFNLLFRICFLEETKLQLSTCFWQYKILFSTLSHNLNRTFSAIISLEPHFKNVMIVSLFGIIHIQSNI